MKKIINFSYTHYFLKKEKKEKKIIYFKEQNGPLEQKYSTLLLLTISIQL
jgi:hypothetical protein